MEKIQALVDGGKANPGPPLGPALGPLGVNIPAIVKDINEKTKNFEGMKVPVTLTIDPSTKEYNIEVGTPPTSALILKEVKKEKGSGKSKSEVIGDLTIKQVIKIVNMKSGSLMGIDDKNRAKEVVGTCVSMGVTVDGKNGTVVISEIDTGVYDKEFI
ncbi:MAG: 50S ribosomal protein L11 [Candidatus Thermoplasmatota archaeon]|nr:50S ribosomal protein L11 [Candidatus Thermoplasmatota archaeon]MCL5963927.1 50S ribosomal protein L11 [Candidatus Thermoplasmatota archaeon]